jgi:hypothetical protein
VIQTGVSDRRLNMNAFAVAALRLRTESLADVR